MGFSVWRVFCRKKKHTLVTLSILSALGEFSGLSDFSLEICGCVWTSSVAFEKLQLSQNGRKLLDVT